MTPPDAPHETTTVVHHLPLRDASNDRTPLLISCSSTGAMRPPKKRACIRCMYRKSRGHKFSAPHDISPHPKCHTTSGIYKSCTHGLIRTTSCVFTRTLQQLIHLPQHT